MNRISLLLLAACSAFAAWAVWEHIQRTTLEDRITLMESEGAARAIKGQAENSKIADASKSLKKKTGAQEPTTGQSEGDAGGSSSAGKQDVAADMAAGFAKMMTNPKMRDVMKAQAR